MNYPYYSTRLFTFLLFILSFGLSQAQQGTEFARVFNRHVLPDDGEEGPSVVITADINGDGHMDIVTASRYDATVRWFENDGSDGFTVHTVATHKGGVDSLIVDDVDGDGLLDIASLGWSSALTWYEQQRDASGNVSFVEDYAHSHKRSQGLFAADVNGDGRLDFLTTASHSESSSFDEIRWYENNGAGNFTQHLISRADQVGPIIAADFDGDGNIDVVTPSLRNREIYLLKNDGEENFTSQLIDDDQTFQPNLLSLVDLDGDGNMDFLAGTTALGVSVDTVTLYWYENKGAEGFIAYTIDDNAPGANTIAAADFNNDGNMDVVAGIYNAAEIRWYENNKEPLNMQRVLPQSIALHPNPMTNVLHISYISTTTVNYTLYDSTGKQLSSQTHTGKEHQLEVSHLASGTYLLKANNDTQFKYYRFMKE